jgi:hypothetical protein
MARQSGSKWRYFGHARRVARSAGVGPHLPSSPRFLTMRPAHAATFVKGRPAAPARSTLRKRRAAAPHEACDSYRRSWPRRGRARASGTGAGRPNRYRQSGAQYVSERQRGPRLRTNANRSERSLLCSLPASSTAATRPAVRPAYPARRRRRAPFGQRAIDRERACAGPRRHALRPAGRWTIRS